MRGYSLIEVLISLVLLSIALLAAFSAQLQSMVQLQSMAESATATRLLGEGSEYYHAHLDLSLWQPEWQQQVATQLPEGIGSISSSSAQQQLIVSWYNHELQRRQQQSVVIQP